MFQNALRVYAPRTHDKLKTAYLPSPSFALSWEEQFCCESLIAIYTDLYIQIHTHWSKHRSKLRGAKRGVRIRWNTPPAPKASLSWLMTRHMKNSTCCSELSPPNNWSNGLKNTVSLHCLWRQWLQQKEVTCCYFKAYCAISVLAVLWLTRN